MSMGPELAAVVQEADANRAIYEQFCRSLSRDELETVIPGMTWRLKDYIAHLATIDIFVADWFEHLADGRPWRPRADDGSAFNIDAWNEVRIQERFDASLDGLFDEAARLRARLWAAVGRFSAEVLGADFDFRGRTITQLRYLQLWTAHDPAHTVDMLRGLPAGRRDSIDVAEEVFDVGSVRLLSGSARPRSSSPRSRTGIRCRSSRRLRG